MSGRRDVDKILRRLRRAGFTATRSGGGHWILRDAEGGFVDAVDSTPSRASVTALLRYAERAEQEQRP
jgi:hypothetical protein